MHDRNTLEYGVITDLCTELKKNNIVNVADYKNYGVKRGLRNDDGSGVMAGLSMICNVHGYVIDDGERVAQPGRLFYRGYDINDIVNSCIEGNRFGYEEVIWLLIFGSLPDSKTLEKFRDVLAECRELPQYFAEDMIIKAPSPNIMNKLARSVLALYSYDDNPDDTSLENVVKQSMQIIARLPSIMTYAYQVKRRSYDHESMFFHPIDKNQTTAEFILSSIRADRQFTDEEAKLLDLCLILHAEHGGGNNSTFTTRVVTSSGTDTYSAIAAAIGSLKGPRHGGANIKTMEMLNEFKANVSDYADDDEVMAYIEKILRKEAGDGKGLIYGMGHAVYTLSDPRAVILHKNAEKLAREKNMLEEFKLLESIERLTPIAFKKIKGLSKPICANVDLYSGLVYKMLGINQDLFTPLFAIARSSGWCAHRVEEIYTSDRIIRPAYKSVVSAREYVPIEKR